MNRLVSGIVLGIVGFALGATAMRLYDNRRAVPPTVAVARPAPAPAIVELPRTANVNLAQEPLWAYGFTEPGEARRQGAAAGAADQQAAAESGSQRADARRGRSTAARATYSLVQIRDLHNVIDWFPGDHPPMTDIITHGPAAMGDQGRGCGSCHLPNGRGRPENAPPAALPVAYFMRQIHDFRNGLRYSADPRKPNTNTMIDLAKAMTDAEMREAAEYFAAIRPPSTPWTRVVETKMSPKVRYVGNLSLPAKDKGVEPIAGRIVEMPEDEEQGDTLRNPHSGFVAYVPPGSIKKGEDLVTTGGMRIVNGKIVQGKTTACGTCHGLDLTGSSAPTCRRSPAARRATSSGSSGTSSRAPATVRRRS